MITEQFYGLVIAGKPKDSAAPNKLIFNSSTVMVSVIKKPAVGSEGNKPEKKENLAKVDEGSSSVLQSLCQSYGSDDDDEQE